MINISEMYIIIRDGKPILKMIFDTEEEAKEYIEKTYVNPHEYRIKLCKFL